MGRSVIAVMLAAALLAWEGFWFFQRSRQDYHRRAWGLLLLVIAGWALLWARLFYLGRLVISPGFGVVLVQGGALTRLGMTLFLGGISVGASLAWSACHEYPREKQVSYLAWRLGMGLAVAVLAAFQLRLLGMDEPELPPISSYDLWFPPLLLWSSICLTGCVLGLLRVRSLESFIALAALLISMLALLSMGRAELTESPFASQWHLTWSACWMLAFPISMGLGAALLLRRFLGPQAWPGKKGRTALVMACWGMGVGLAVLALRGNGAPPWPCWAALGVMFAAAFAAAVHRMKDLQLPGLSLPCRRITVFALLTLPWIIAVPLLSSESGLLLGLSGVLLIATVLAETLLKGPLYRRLSTWHLSFTGAAPPETAREEHVRPRGWLARGGQQLRRGYAWLSARKPLRFILATIPLVLVFLIALNEVPNAGKTVIQPFLVSGLSTSQEQAQELGQTLSESLTASIGDLQQVLQPEVVLQQPGDTKQMEQLGYASDTSGASTVSAQSLVLELGAGIKVPFHMLAAPIQAPVRALLGVKVIRGLLYEDQTHYVLLARSSTGSAWRVELDKKALMGKPPQAEPKLADAVARLTQKLAFEILSKDPRLMDTGITRLPEAFDSFRQGVESWELSERTGDYTSLDQSIHQFREAIQRDPGFALAYYRLGLALQKNGQPDQATMALRNSVKLNPRFLPGQVALASVYLQPESSGPLVRTTVATPPKPKPLISAKVDARRSEARRLWQRIIQFPGHQLEKTQAYYGLCLLGFDASDEETDWDLASQKRLRAYFYCTRAERMYGRLPASWHNASTILESEAHVQSTLGQLFERPEISADKPQEACPLSVGEHAAPPSWETQPRLLHYRAALRYYQRATELSATPSQNIAFRCGVARVAYLLGDMEPMETLSREASAYVYRADLYGDSVWNDAWYDKSHEELIATAYRGALMEYEQAINIDPTNVDALIRYAYNFWEWRFRFPGKEPPQGPSQEQGQLAERFARRASTLRSNEDAQMWGALALSAEGEVLLGQARPGEAIPIIEKAERLVSSNAIFDELRWDLAQAYLCQAARLEQDGTATARPQALRRKAQVLLSRIHQNDQDREDKIFPDPREDTRPSVLAPSSNPPEVCLSWTERRS